MSDYASYYEPVGHHVGEQDYHPNECDSVGQIPVVGMGFLPQRLCQNGPSQFETSCCHGRIRLATYSIIAHTAM